MGGSDTSSFLYLHLCFSGDGLWMRDIFLLTNKHFGIYNAIHIALENETVEKWARWSLHRVKEPRFFHMWVKLSDFTWFHRLLGLCIHTQPKNKLQIVFTSYPRNKDKKKTTLFCVPSFTAPRNNLPRHCMPQTNFLSFSLGIVCKFVLTGEKEGCCGYRTLIFCQLN